MQATIKKQVDLSEEFRKAIHEIDLSVGHTMDSLVFMVVELGVMAGMSKEQVDHIYSRASGIAYPMMSSAAEAPKPNDVIH